MKKRGKKGISPLIATVLLIGFIVVVAVIVMLWGRGYIKEKAEKEGALSEKQLECNLVEIEVSKDLDIENKGSRSIDGFIIRRAGGSVDKYGRSTEDPLPGILPLKQGVLIDLNLGRGDTIIPALIPEGVGAPLVPCSDKSKKIREEG